MPKIMVKGPIIANDDAWIYDWFEMDYTTPKKVDEQLAAAGGAEVEVDINSGGGYVDEGSEIYSALKSYSGQVIVNIVGIAASAASVIAMAGDIVRISPTAQIMIHNSALIAAGDHRDMTHASTRLQKTDVSISNAYRLKTGMSEEELLQLMAEETWFTAQDALEKKLVDEILHDPNGQLKPVANLEAAQMLPAAVVAKMRNDKQINARSLSTAKTPENTPAALTAKGEEPKIMNEEQLKEKFPDLYNQLLNKGATDGADKERTRIAALNELADAPGASEIVADAIKNGETPEAAAMKIVAASKQRTANVGAARAADGKASNAADVPAAEAPLGEKTQADKDAEEEDARAQANANWINQKRGGRR
ncbi:hypothetical protein B9G55_01405 [Saccharibacillus sp. O16]|nr:hypothetical protein B9G55_01405 [Saccharibacillus sp. O16]